MSKRSRLSSTFATSSTTKSPKACFNCKKTHRKCHFELNKPKSCKRCIKLKLKCSSINPDVTRDLRSSETIYATALQQNANKSQYITSTQPLAPILSKDSILCFDGELLGLFSPWKDSNYYFNNKSIMKHSSIPIDPDLKEFLMKKKTFELPKRSFQIELLKLYYDNVYPLYPIIQKDMKLEDIPLLLLNAIMLSAIRYTKDLNSIRSRADEFKTKCKHLEMVETNKLTLIQSFLLISTNEEGPEGAALAREYASKASMLCTEIGINILDESTLDQELIDSEFDTNSYKAIFKSKFERSLVSRIFWTSFCCDRYLSVSSGSAMFYNTFDFLIQEPTLNDFNDCLEDYLIFTKWLSLCKLFDRILCSIYRPPGQRSIDETIEKDIFYWDVQNDIENIEIAPIFKSFLQLTYYYCNVLFLRCRIGVLNLIELTRETQPDLIGDSSTPLSFTGMKYVQLFTSKILKKFQYPKEKRFEHIINVHALLHIMVFIHLEIQVKYEVNNKDEKFINFINDKFNQLHKGLEILNNLRVKFWLSGAGHQLFHSLITRQSLSSEDSDSFNKIYSQIYNNQQELTTYNY